MFPRCSHCGGLLYKDTDGYEKYLVCFGCAREFDFDMIPRRITPSQCYHRYNIKLTISEERAKIRLE